MIKNDLGFIIPTLQNTQYHNNLCGLVKLLIDNNKRFQFCIFNQYNELIDNKCVPLMPISHARYFDGDLIILDFNSLILAINFPLIHNIYYFTNTMPWADLYNSYTGWKNIFTKNNLKVFTGSEDIADIYRIAWNIEAQTMQEINYENIISVL